MKTNKGTVEISVGIRSDGTPLLNLRAADEGGRRVLTRTFGALEAVRLLALTKRKADIYNICGQQTITDPKDRSQELTIALTIALALGGIGLRRDPRMRPKKVKKAGA